MLFLVVDDDELSRELLTLLLEGEGYSVSVASSGDEAIVLLKESSLQPDVILTDMQMPGISGTALAEALRNVCQNGIRLLAMSGSQPQKPKIEAFDGFLLKPFTIAELQSAVEDPRTPKTRNRKPRKSATRTPKSEAIGIASVNEEIYAKLGKLMPPLQLGQMYTLCISDARKRIARMRQLAAARDEKQYRAEAHTIKGGAGLIGATEIYQLAAAEERDGLLFRLNGNSDAKSDAAHGTISVTAQLDGLSLACDRLERILVERLRK